MTIAFDLLQDHYFHLSKHETGVLHQVMAATKAGVGVKDRAHHGRRLDGRGRPPTLRVRCAGYGGRP
jgi:hypothetical protein